MDAEDIVRTSLPQRPLPGQSSAEMWGVGLQAPHNRIETQAYHSSLGEMLCRLCPAKSRGQGYSSVSGRWDPCPSGPGGQSIKLRLFSSLDLMLFVLLGFDLPGTYHPFLSYFSVLEWECLTLCLYDHYILEAHNLFEFTGSQLERNLSQDESLLESHRYLT